MEHRDNLKGALGAFILFGAIACAGTIAAYAAVEDFARARASLSWPTVEGVVLSADQQDGNVRYAWFDGAESHTGARVRFWMAAFDASGRVYDPGDRIVLRISPDDGAVAVLEPGGSAVLFAVALFFGAFLVFVGLAGIIRLAMLVDGLAPAHRREFELAPAE